MFLCFMDRKYTLSATSGKKIIEMKNAELCSIGLWKWIFIFSVGKNTWLLSYRCTQETRLRVLLWKILHNIYPTKFNILLSKMEVRDNNYCSYCIDTVDVIELFLLNVRLYLNFEIHRRIYFTRVWRKDKAALYYIMFGVQRPNMQTYDIKFI